MNEAEGIPFIPGQSHDTASGKPNGPGRDDLAPRAAQRSSGDSITALTCGYESPLGHMTLAECNGRIIGAWFDGQKHDRAHLGDSRPARPKESPALNAATAWLDAYFRGANPGEPPALAPVGTPFQQAVWDELLAIPYGGTTTYGEIARQLSAITGHEESPRAVGSAVGRNPILVMVPCHRVVGASESLTGYAAGIDRKERLLRLEGVRLLADDRAGANGANDSR
jgi:methylated-DNA-[protein]-cysteine S-methyltransferase